MTTRGNAEYYRWPNMHDGARGGSLMCKECVNLSNEAQEHDKKTLLKCW